MEEEKRLSERLARAADLQDTPIPGVPLIEIAGDGRVLIENHKGVTQYSKQRICVKVKFGQVCICGQGLRVAKMTKSQLIICGKIESVELFRGCK